MSSFFLFANFFQNAVLVFIRINPVNIGPSRVRWPKRGVKGQNGASIFLLRRGLTGGRRNERKSFYSGLGGGFGVNGFERVDDGSALIAVRGTG